MARRSQPDLSAADKAFSLLPAMLAEAGIQADSGQLAQFRIHYDLLLRWNARTNLTAIHDPMEILRRHFVESAFVTRVLALGPGTLVDVGSGAGFPGIPIKVLSPQTRVILVESTQKKAAFLKEVVRSLGLPSLEVQAERLEDIDIEADWLTMRAVRLTQELARVFKKVVPRGTMAILVAPEDTPTGWRSIAIPGYPRRVVASIESSTWNSESVSSV